MPVRMALVKELTEDNGRQGEEIKRLTDRCVGQRSLECMSARVRPDIVITEAVAGSTRIL